MLNMDDVDIFRTDFHALRVLVAVQAAGSLSGAADALGLNQSTVSYTIERLRGVFSDPLFVRQGRGVVPTERCQAVARQAEALLRSFEDMTRPQHFDPATATARLVVSCNYYERNVLVPPFFQALRREAPGIRLSLVQALAHGHQQLLAGECDLLVSPLTPDVAGLFRRTLFSERYVCFVARDGPHAGGLDFEAYARAAHVVISYEGGWRPFYFETLAALELTITPALEVPSFGNVHRMMGGSDLVVTAPSGLAPLFVGTCVTVAAPFDCRFEEHMFWSARSHGSPANKWLREHMAAAARGAAALLGLA